MKKIIILLITTLFPLNAQSKILFEYIKTGLDNNLVLKQKNIAIEKASASLKEARSLFFPVVNFQSDYNIADGGRKIDIPVGDMLNPVYSTLNQLTQSKSFPNIQNQSTQLLPDDYHDTRIELKMPIFNTDIWYNNKIKEEAINLKNAEKDTYKRELVKEIRTAYYNYLKSVRAIEIYKNAGHLLNDNYTLTESLIKNNMALKSSLLKLSAEISKNEAALTESVNNSKNAASYFNFLLNKPLDSEISADTSLLNSNETSFLSTEYTAAGREELTQIKSGITQTEYLKSMNNGEYIPTLGAFLAAGYQGTKFKFDSDQRYYLFGLQVKWNLFNGFGSSAKKEQTEYDISALKLKLEETEKQLNLQISAAVQNLNTSQAKVKSAKLNLEYSQEYYRQMRLRYMAGQALLIELTDALNQHINNQMIYQIASAEVLIKKAELERAAAKEIF